MTTNDCVFSLEEKQAFGGNLVALPLDRFLRQGADLAAFKACRIRQQSTFDFGPEKQRTKELLVRIAQLRGEKLLQATESQNGLTLYKYSRRVFYDRFWDRDPLLLKTRGLVLDRALQIVQHPFDKVFNLGENGTAQDIPGHTPVVATEKLNGFLCCVTRHPHDSGRLLITTTGSFDSPFVEMARETLMPYKGTLLKLLRESDITLMFEVIHPKDPHIIAYADADHGPWLIGARGKGWDDTCWTEADLDGLGGGYFRRPAWQTTTLGAIKEARKFSRLEGWMVRRLEPSEPFICKVKTDYYLTTKFLGRLSDSKVAYLFNSPQRFKKEVDEEFYDLVDSLSSSVTREQFLGLAKPERVALVRSLLD
ncbi:MAG: RNA ligase [Planctomycetia bacterium]|nr:RNA ligase [Planctomycetia bacterium]